MSDNFEALKRISDCLNSILVGICPDEISSFFGVPLIAVTKLMENPSLYKKIVNKKIHNINVDKWIVEYFFGDDDAHMSYLSAVKRSKNSAHSAVSAPAASSAPAAVSAPAASSARRVVKRRRSSSRSATSVRSVVKRSRGSSRVADSLSDDSSCSDDVPELGCQPINEETNQSTINWFAEMFRDIDMKAKDLGIST